MINVLLPIETISRELDYQLFFACMASHSGNRFFIGQHDVIYGLSKFINGGIWMGKTIFPQEFPAESGARYRDVKSRGCVLIHLDEEGGVFRGDRAEWPDVLHTRLDPTLLAPEDYLCTWGDFQRDVYLADRPKNASRVRTTGHPRFDLYKPRYREYFAPAIRAIERRLKPFVLINTNLTLANNPLGVSDTFSERLQYDPSDGTLRRRWVEGWAHTTHVLAGFVKLVNVLSLEMPAVNFVIRPHPSEDLTLYTDVFRSVPNVHVIREGSVGPWLFSCEALVQDGCTTAVEAHLAGKPVVNYRPFAYPPFDFSMPNSLGVRLDNEADVISTIDSVIKGRPFVGSAPNEEARSVLCNFESDSFSLFLSVFNECESQQGQAQQSLRAKSYVVEEARRRASIAARGIARPLFRERMRRYRAYASMFPGFDRADIGARLERCQTVLGKRVRHTYYAPDLISVEAA